MIRFVESGGVYIRHVEQTIFDPSDLQSLVSV